MHENNCNWRELKITINIYCKLKQTLSISRYASVIYIYRFSRMSYYTYVVRAVHSMHVIAKTIIIIIIM